MEKAKESLPQLCAHTTLSGVSSMDLVLGQVTVTIFFPETLLPHPGELIFIRFIHSYVYLSERVSNEIVMFYFSGGAVS